MHLNFSEKYEDGRPASLDGNLKALVLSQVTVTAASCARTTAGAGMGVVRKTCALRGLATDTDVQKTFVDGV